jgi:hypothetical protein
MKLRILLLGASLIAVSGLAVAAGLQWRTESATWTEPAGLAAGATVESLVTPEYFAIQGLKAWDFDGRICSLQLEQGSFNAPGSRPLDPLRLCEPKQTQSWKRADIGSGQFVTAISVCTAPGKDQGPELHGVELWGASIDARGKLKPAKAPVRFEFARCEKWAPRRTCPAGSVATGIRAHTADGQSGALGLALRCHALSLNSN